VQAWEKETKNCSGNIEKVLQELTPLSRDERKRYLVRYCLDFVEKQERGEMTLCAASFYIYKLSALFNRDTFPGFEEFLEIARDFSLPVRSSVFRPDADWSRLKEILRQAS
jgi:hypothetical protein